MYLAEAIKSEAKLLGVLFFYELWLTNPNPLQTSGVKGMSSGSPMLRVTYNQGISELNSVNNTFSDSYLKSY